MTVEAAAEAELVQPITAVRAATAANVPILADTNGLEWRAKVRVLVAEMAKHPQVPCPLKHHFAPGVYIREITMPAGAIVIGKIHKTAHFNIIQRGRCVIVGAAGHLELGPCTFVSEPGIQKTLLILEETVWSTVHVTDERDLDSLEAQLIEPDDYPLADRTEERRAIAAAAAVEAHYIEHHTSRQLALAIGDHIECPS